MNYKLRLCFKDRMGIVADISTTLARSGFNIVSMEVDRSKDEAHVYTEIENIEQIIDNNGLFHLFDTMADFIEIKFIETLPQEERTNRFRVVLDNMSDGVISIDRDGKITTMNRVAAEVFMRSAQDIVGKSIKSLDLPRYEILKCLKGEKIDSLKQNLIIANRRYQYVSTCKPIRDSSDRIIGAVEIAKEMQEIKKLAQSISLEIDGTSFTDIIGKTQIMKDAITFAEKIAPTDITVSLYGPSGTGKELFAKAIHTASGRKGLYVPVNCAALPEQLLESELFGYAEGSFTGGKKDGKQGLFESATDGTVFLDEIAEMPLGSQAKLLRLLQEKAVRRIGETREISINTRIVTATNKDLDRLVKQGKFREDLYYRINVIPIHIPPLKHRKEDIPLLLEHFLFQLFIRLGKNISFLTPSALEKLNMHDWPGNVRELKNVVERAAFLSDGKVIDVDSVLFSGEMASCNGKTRYRHVDFHEDRQGYLKKLSLKEQVGEFEKHIIINTLENQKTVRKSALELKLSHPALLKKMQKYYITLEKIVTTGN
ncbi:MAG: sigma 54-interacting transcriptional regulator [Desulfamplus sp.]|nr:sigma 54-interacting transcriptional regulator [Desulfamplus sp.]